jgi:DNA-binding CsgD family transcriptional regulator
MHVDVSSVEVDGEEYCVVGYALRRPRSFASLTPAELEVAEGMIAGLSTRLLARQRGVSERTVANQLARIYRKLRICSKYDLLALVGRSGRPQEE